MNPVNSEEVPEAGIEVPFSCGTLVSLGPVTDDDSDRTRYTLEAALRVDANGDYPNEQALRDHLEAELRRTGADLELIAGTWLPPGVEWSRPAAAGVVAWLASLTDPDDLELLAIMRRAHVSGLLKVFAKPSEPEAAA